MADYSSWKVTDLKAELKRRGIPQTGLRLKQQIIDRLLQADATEKPDTSAEKSESKDVSHQEQNASSHGPPVEPSRTEEAPSEKPQKVPEPTIEAEASKRTPPEPSLQSTQTRPEDATGPEITPIPTQQSTEKESEREILQKTPILEKHVADIRDPEMEMPDAPAEVEAAQTSEIQPIESSAEPRATNEESDESRKRKRRSQSPPPSPRSAALKRAKAEDGYPRVILQEDLPSAQETPKPGLLETENIGKQSEILPDAPELRSPEPPRHDQQEPPKITEPKTSETHDVMSTKSEKQDTVVENSNWERPLPEDQETVRPQHEEPSDELPPIKKPAGDARFKDLFSSANGAPAQEELSPAAEDTERDVAPALHPATTSLYIRNFMRPLTPANLRKHLVALATPPHADADPDMILNFFLDSIRTHCFVTFTSISAASRVRTALHDTIWPEERARKPLWVDFIPEEKVKEWTEIEQAPENTGHDAPRWEVSYEDSAEGITAILHESGLNAARINRNQSFDLGRGPPTGPRAERGLGRGGPSSVHVPESGFKALDDRFLSTQAKPKLYFLPVPKDISDKRLDKFDDLASAGPTRKPDGDEMRRYTFEDNDFFVDHGPEYGARRGRAPRGRGASFADYGGSWRGRR